MRWWWQKRPLPEIPPFKMDFKAPQVKDPAYVVEEVAAADEDLEALRAAQTQTGMHRVWRRLTGQDPSV